MVASSSCSLCYIVAEGGQGALLNRQSRHTVDAEKDYIYREFGGGINSQKYYICFCVSVPDPN